MTVECVQCGRSIDTAHDEHYRCRTKSHNEYLCKSCNKSGRARCRRCNRRLIYVAGSITKDAFRSPGTRGTLGF